MEKYKLRWVPGKAHEEQIEIWYAYDPKGMEYGSVVRYKGETNVWLEFGKVSKYKRINFMTLNDAQEFLQEHYDLHPYYNL